MREDFRYPPVYTAVPISTICIIAIIFALKTEDFFSMVGKNCKKRLNTKPIGMLIIYMFIFRLISWNIFKPSGISVNLSLLFGVDWESLLSWRYLGQDTALFYTSEHRYT